MEQLSGYAPDLSPDLNPDEGIWQYLKKGTLKTGTSKTCVASKSEH